jgi:hypothetical protein
MTRACGDDAAILGPIASRLQANHLKRSWFDFSPTISTLRVPAAEQTDKEQRMRYETKAKSQRPASVRRQRICTTEIN